VDGGIVQTANRPALPSDYYSRKKITVTPLDFVCNCRRALPHSARNSHSGKTPRENFLRLRIFTDDFPRHAEMPMKYGFLRFIVLQIQRPLPCRALCSWAFSNT